MLEIVNTIILMSEALVIAPMAFVLSLFCVNAATNAVIASRPNAYLRAITLAILLAIASLVSLLLGLPTVWAVWLEPSLP